MKKRQLVDIGDVFSRLTVVANNIAKKGGRYHLCRCECGTEKLIYHANLYHGKSRSCGCLSREVSSKRERTHGMSKTKIYQVWSRMLRRCDCPSSSRYKNYGGRGIKVCDEWKLFENFYSDMGDIPSTKHSIGRIDNDGDYTASNVEWQLPKEQANNTSRNIYIEHKGKTQTLAQWCQELGIPYERTSQRMKLGITPPRLFSSRKFNVKYIRFNGETRKTTEWMRLYNIPISSFYHHKRNGLKDEEIISKYQRLCKKQEAA